MKISTRVARAQDLKMILDLNFKLFQKEYREYDKSLNLHWTNSKQGKKYFQWRVNKSDGFVEVAEFNEKVVGYIAGGLSERKFYRKRAVYAELENMFVEEKHRSKGIGKIFVKDFLKWCVKKKVDYISVTASAENIRAIDFYRKCGFKNYNITLERLAK